MAQWGTANQAVTVTGATTKETSTGAPIGTWGLVKGGGRVGNYMGANANFGNSSPGTKAGVDLNMFGNTTVGAFVPGMAVDVLGVNVATMASLVGPAHAGWQVKRVGTGYVSGAAVSAQAGANNAGMGPFANGETVTVSSTAGANVANATLTVVTNASGNIASLNLKGGSGWQNTSDFTLTWNRDQQWLSNVQIAVPATGYTLGNMIAVTNGAAVAYANITATSVTNAALAVVNNALWANVVGTGNLVVSMVNSSFGTTLTGNTTVSSFTVQLSNSGGTPPTVGLTVGGRAGRVSYETLIAGGTYT